MLTNMNIPKKLGVSFLIVSLSAAVMTIVFFVKHLGNQERDGAEQPCPRGLCEGADAGDLNPARE